MSQHKSTIIALVLLTLATLLVYLPALGQFFCGDDFVHLEWLSRAVMQPQLIWKNFYTTWLDLPNTQFYRPMVSLFMVSDYILWHGKAFGFHLTNLVCHILNSIFLWSILKTLSSPQENTPNSDLTKTTLQSNQWPLVSAWLFALYPLHPEVVTWITGRVDSIVTLFYLGSLWCYLQWRFSQTKTYAIVSGLLMVFALLSKEMAIMLPATFVAFELIWLNDAKTIQLVWKVIQTTYVYWLILLAYFVLRRTALGTFIGGYDNSLMPIQGWHAYCHDLWRSLKICLIPINQTIFSPDSLLVRLWLCFLLISCLANLWTILRCLQKRDTLDLRAPMFITSFLILSVIPVLKLLNISPDLQTSRLFYLPSAPLCALLCYGMVNLAPTWGKHIHTIVVTLFLSLSAYLLYTNNLPWANAGQQTRAILRGLDEIAKTSLISRTTFFVGLPNEIDGAYVCQNAIDGMTKFPQISQTIPQCFNLNDSDRSFPFGFARPVIANARLSHVVLWRQDKRQFEHFVIGTSSNKTISPGFPDSSSDKTSHSASKEFCLTGKDLKNHTELLFTDPTRNNHQIRYEWLRDGSLNIFGHSCPNISPEIALHLRDLPCWHSELLRLNISSLAPLNKNTKSIVSLLWTNDLYPKIQIGHRIDSPLIHADQSVYFCLHSIASWSCGGQSQLLKICLPPGLDLNISHLTIENPESMLPQLSLRQTANQNRLGFIELNPNQRSCQLSYTVQKIAYAKNACLEISHPNVFFSIGNSATIGQDTQSKITLLGNHGIIKLNLSNFVSNGIYQIRLHALNEHGLPIAFASDHIMVSVKH